MIKYICKFVILEGVFIWGLSLVLENKIFNPLEKKGIFIKFWVLKLKNIQGELAYEKIHLSFI